MITQKVLCPFLLLLFFQFIICERETFSEDLIIRPLSDGNVLAHFQFTSTINFGSINNSLSHFQLFPRSVAQVVQEFGVEQFKVFFTQGRWDYNNWGLPIIDSPSGVQLIASFLSSRDVDAEWKRLSSSLSGMFCSSVNALNERTVADPRFTHQDMYTSSNHRNITFENELETQSTQILWQEELIEELHQNLLSKGQSSFGLWPENLSSDTRKLYINRQRTKHDNSKTEKNKHSIRYGEMPEEAVCTENLTPWVKLLPCRDQSGFGLLLNPLTIYNSLFHSMGAIVRIRLPAECSTVEECQNGVGLELIQTLTAVFKAKSEFSVAELFGRDSITSCQLAKSSKIFVELGNKYEDFISVKPSPGKREGNYLLYSPDHLHSLNPSFKIEKKKDFALYLKKTMVKAPVSVTRNSLGQGEVNAGVLTSIVNHENTPLNLTYFEYLPWYLPIYYHSLRTFLDSSPIPLPSFAHSWRLQPAEDHSIPSVIEIFFEIPAKSTIFITYQYDKAFLQWTKHPPDAHRGVDVASASVTVHYDKKPEKFRTAGLDWSPLPLNETANWKEDSAFDLTFYSEGLLVLLPTPDFSMPYNVITLTGTIFAIIFTTSINVFTRRFSYIIKGGEYSSGRLSMYLYRKVRDYMTN